MQISLDVSGNIIPSLRCPITWAASHCKAKCPGEMHTSNPKEPKDPQIWFRKENKSQIWNKQSGKSYANSDIEIRRIIVSHKNRKCNFSDKQKGRFVHEQFVFLDSCWTPGQPTHRSGHVWILPFYQIWHVLDPYPSILQNFDRSLHDLIWFCRKAALNNKTNTCSRKGYLKTYKTS